MVLDADGSIAGKYRKMHIPDDPLYFEKFYFTPGDLGFPSFQTRYAKIGALVCWDQWFPEAARLASLSGAEILVYPTAIGWIPKEPRAAAQKQRNAWELIQRAHAIANGVFVASVNRVGREANLKFWGGSFVAGPSGEILAVAGGDREQILIARCDLRKIDEPARVGPSSEIAESTPMGHCRRDSSIRPTSAVICCSAILMANQNKYSPMPRDLGYSMPAEWVPHRATWLSWPHNQETWPAQFERVRDAWVQMILALSPHEKVYLLVNDDPTQQDVSVRLKAAGAVMENVAMIKIPTVDVWMRDYGPTFVVRNRQDVPLAINDWIFNGWGGKYKAYEHDDGVAKNIAELLGVPVFAHPLVLEGGAIEVNGAGICLTTEQCLLNKNRNPHLNRAEIEQFLKDSLGVSQIIWLGEGVAGDDTDGHIDDIARFVNATTVVCAVEDDPRDANYAALQENFERLKGARDHSGSRLDIDNFAVSAPCPLPRIALAGQLCQFLYRQRSGSRAYFRRS